MGMFDLRDFVSGVAAIENVDNFPLESMPRQGTVRLTFNTGTSIELMSDETTYRKVKFMTDLQPKPVKVTKQLVESAGWIHAVMESNTYHHPHILKGKIVFGDGIAKLYFKWDEAWEVMDENLTYESLASFHSAMAVPMSS